jgi:isoquinoline 1-oxidoreductase alpha subunit
MIMAAAALLKEKPDPTREDIAEAITNLCRCGTYPRIRRAIFRAARGDLPPPLPGPDVSASESVRLAPSLRPPSLRSSSMGPADSQPPEG